MASNGLEPCCNEVIHASKMLEETSTISEKTRDKTIQHYDYDLLLLYDDHDEITERKVIPALDREGIKYISPHLDGHPGRSLFKDIEVFLPKCRKVCVVCSDKLNDNRRMLELAEIIVLHRKREHMICLLMKEVQFHLTHTNKIFINNPEWCSDLVSEIRRDTSDRNVMSYFNSDIKINRSFCEITTSEKLSHCLKLCNLNFGDLNYTFHGVKFSPTQPFVEVYYKDFIENIAHHQKGDIKSACEEFPDLVGKETRLKLIINTEPCAENNDLFFQEFSKLFNSVHDVRLTKDLWFMRMYTIDGPMKNEPFLMRIHTEIIKEIAGNILSDKCAFRPLYADERKRVDSFAGHWDETTAPSIDDMASSGFFFDVENNVSWCFYCAVGSFIWPKDLNVLSWHAKCMPTCSHIQQSCSMEFIEHAKTLDFEHEKFDQYEHFDKRKASFDESFGQNVTNREQFIDNLALSGFFFSGFHDIIHCYYCRRYLSCVGLKSDIRAIWALHAGLSPNCSHVINKKGVDYVEDIQAAREQNDPDVLLTITCFLKTPGVDRPWHKGAIQP